MPTLRRCSPCVIVCDITVIVLYTRLKCQLSGDVLHDSQSLLNSIKSNPECFVLLIQTPFPLNLYPVYACPCVGIFFYVVYHTGFLCVFFGTVYALVVPSL